MLNQVFISYQHESLEHARAVYRLGELLRKAKIPVALDKFYCDEYPGGPNEGWPKWCEDRANESICVLIIASEGWFAAYNKTGQQSTGLGAATEADIIRQELYDKRGNNARFRLVFLHNVAAGKVPMRLSAWRQFRPFDSGDQLDSLIHWIAVRLGSADIKTPTVRWPSPLEFQPDLADRSRKEWPAIVELLAGRSRERILLYEGASGQGKTLLMRQAAVYARTLGLLVVCVDFKGSELNVPGVLGQFQLEISAHLPNCSREGAVKIHLLRQDLRSLRQPVLVIFDTYEAARGNKALEDWLSQQFLPEVETAMGLAVIIAGQKMPPDYGKAGWSDLARHLTLEPIMEVEHWKPWVRRHYPDFRETGADLRTIVWCAEGNPLNVKTSCETISKRNTRSCV